MPAKPAWYGKLGSVVAQLEALPRPTVDTATLEFLLGVGRRRAQQILAPCITHRVGASGLAERAALIAHLHLLAEGDDGYYEQRRRKKLANALEQFRRERLERPRLLVEAPAAVARCELQELPTGVRLEAGLITIEFDEPRQALEKLLALAMAIGNDFGEFEQATARRTSRSAAPVPLCAGERLSTH
jgi:hypothetical protein